MMNENHDRDGDSEDVVRRFTWPWKLVERVRPAMAVATGMTSDGDETNGTAFHIGDGYFVTARHVAELFGLRLRMESGSTPLVLEIHSSISGADVSVIRTDGIASTYLDLGSNWDDVGPDGLIGAPVLLMGYPPIPKADRAVCVVAPGHLSAIIDRYDGVDHCHYITSVAPRGGFSGAPLIAAWDENEPWVMAVFVESLAANNQAPDNGFGAALSIDPVWRILEERNIRCAGIRWIEEFG